MAQARMPSDVPSMVESVRLIGDLDEVLQTVLSALTQSERLLTPMHDGGPVCTQLGAALWDVREAVRSAEAARLRVRPLVRRLAAHG